jgi:phospholipid/cholesterol/gamma-HCH transport system ATP-binding protein
MRQEGATGSNGAAIRFDQVSKSFGDLRVLDDVSFEVRRGEAFCILGRSGAGKSVTLRHLVGLIKPDRGRIFVEDEEINALDPQELARVRKRIGFLFQYSALFDSISVGENVAFPLRRHTRRTEREVRERARLLLESVGLSGVYDRMPAQMSGGMQKRAALARALALSPPILLVDEPSSGLDPVTAREIDELLLGLKERDRTTMVVVTHNIPSARILGNELALLHQGRILARGTAAQLEASGHELVQAFLNSHGGN